MSWSCFAGDYVTFYGANGPKTVTGEKSLAQTERVKGGFEKATLLTCTDRLLILRGASGINAERCPRAEGWLTRISQDWSARPSG
jgi:hypothetical protein